MDSFDRHFQQDLHLIPSAHKQKHAQVHTNIHMQLWGKPQYVCVSESPDETVCHYCANAASCRQGPHV